MRVGFAEEFTFFYIKAEKQFAVCFPTSVQSMILKQTLNHTWWEWDNGFSLQLNQYKHV